jgi:hypothetical protein
MPEKYARSYMTRRRRDEGGKALLGGRSLAARPELPLC